MPGPSPVIAVQDLPPHLQTLAKVAINKDVLRSEVTKAIQRGFTEAGLGGVKEVHWSNNRAVAYRCSALRDSELPRQTIGI